MAFIIPAILKDLLQMDHVSTEVVGEDTIYTFKTTSLIPSLVEFKAKVLSILDAPVDIPKNVEVTEVKRGRVFKEYIVKIYVPREGVGRVSDVLAKRYGVIRRRPYSGER